MSMTIEPLGDSALVIRVGRQIDEQTRRTVGAVAHALAASPISGVLDVVPGFTNDIIELFDNPMLETVQGTWKGDVITLDRANGRYSGSRAVP